MAIRRRGTSDSTEPDSWAKQLATVMDGTGTERGVDDGRHRDENRVLVVGGGQVGRRIAEGLATTHHVHHVDADPNVVRTEAYGTSHAPDLTSPAAMARIGITAEDVAVVATGLDARNLLVVQQLRTRFGVERLLVVVEDPRNREALDLPGVTVVCAGTVLSEAVDSAVLDSDEGNVGEDAPAATD
ncbi:NAD-binding protein [Salinirubellus sp. GCM10025818]|uniref:NAD-binding protein n=1 Tax=Salinirubellus TaxID=2162630 RepID=UPI0030D0471D